MDSIKLVPALQNCCNETFFFFTSSDDLQMRLLDCRYKSVVPSTKLCAAPRINAAICDKDDV